MRSLIVSTKFAGRGQVFGTRVVLGESFRVRVAPDKAKMHCVAKCNKCGSVAVLPVYVLRSQRCRCVIANHVTHGLCRGTKNGPPTHGLWNNMLQRCNNPKNTRWDDYGGRGIKVCDEWQDFAAFHAWAMANGYAPGLQIDRINNDGDYEPLNCRFVTPSENQRNKRSNRRVEAFGEIKTAAEWARDERCRVGAGTLLIRLRLGWPAEAAITESPNPMPREFRRAVLK